MLARMVARVGSGVLGRDLTNTLYYGDNLEILTRFISDETVDLVYLDPPFNRNAAYSVIFRDESGRTSDAQMATLEDYWHWGPTPARHYEYLTNSAEHAGAVPHPVSDLIGALHSAIRPSPMLAYLVEMAVGLIEMRRVLKPTGSLYLHCDPTASHYLKLLLDATFGPKNFRNDIAWKRKAGRGETNNAAVRFGVTLDNILFYAKSDQAPLNRQYRSSNPAYIASKFTHLESDGRRYRLDNLTSPSPRPNLYYPYKGHLPPRNGWAVSLARMQEMDAARRLYIPTNPARRIQRKRYLDELAGETVDSLWDDISPINSQAKERLGFPTQKPVALLNRIIEASSNPGDLVLDPYCGCGTALEAAVGLGREWIGIDISNLAVDVIRRRMMKLGIDVPVFDWPTELDGVKRMVEGPDGRRRFETWALARLGLAENRRGADAGIDGRIVFTGPGGRLETIVVSVKSGHVGSAAIRDLKGTMGREHAVMGLLFTFEDPTPSATKEINEAGFYRSPLDGHQYPKVVVFTARELLEDGRLPDLPTRHGIQPQIWPIPASGRSVRLRSIKRKERISPEANLPDAPSIAPSPEVRERYRRDRETVAGETSSEAEVEVETSVE